MKNWFDIPRPEVSWLVDGLIPADGHTAICGKPKAGKSTFIRNLIVAVVKNTRFLGRSIDIPEGTGRVLYIHLDRKDQDWRVADELKQLGITQSESDRITLMNATELPDESDDRFMWLQRSIVESTPNLIVIDLLIQFLNLHNPNDYAEVMKGINKLQDSLKQSGYKGALVVAIHGRKAVNPDQPFDDMLGSTGQRGSFSTNIMLTQHRREGVYRAAAESDLQLIWELLAQREREILANFLQGMSNSEIAKYLRTTQQVVKNYFSSIFEKTGMGSRLELLLFIVDRPLLRAELNNLFEGMQNGTIEFGTRYGSRRVSECVLAG